MSNFLLDGYIPILTTANLIAITVKSFTYTFQLPISCYGEPDVEQFGSALFSS